MAKKNSGEAEALNAWIVGNPSASKLRRQIAGVMAKNQELSYVWPELKKHGINPLHFFSIVCHAYEQMERETRRQTKTEEETQLKAVERLTRQLKDAIEKSPLPANTAYGPYELSTVGFPVVNAMVGWRDLQEDGYGFGYSISIVEMLDVALGMLKRHQESMPIRAVSRHGSNPKVTAFVRWLAFCMGSRFKCELHGTIAHLTTAIFDLDATNPPDKKGVKNLLKDRPEPFKALNKRRLEP